MIKAHDPRTGCAYAEQIDHSCGSSAWLSADMAEALAATAPALTCGDVVHAADQLTLDMRPARVADDLLRRGADLLQAGRVIEVLLVLREVA